MDKKLDSHCLICFFLNESQYHGLLYVLAISRAEAKAIREVDAELHAKVKTMEKDMIESEREKQFLQTTIDRLQKEKQQLIIDATRRADKNNRGILAMLDGYHTKQKSADILKFYEFINHLHLLVYIFEFDFMKRLPHFYA